MINLFPTAASSNFKQNQPLHFLIPTQSSVDFSAQSQLLSLCLLSRQVQRCISVFVVTHCSITMFNWPPCWHTCRRRCRCCWICTVSNPIQHYLLNSFSCDASKELTAPETQQHSSVTSAVTMLRLYLLTGGQVTSLPRSHLCPLRAAAVGFLG